MNEQHKNIVKYHNDLNEITFQKFNQVDFDFFMVLCSKLRDSQNNEVTISKDDKNYSEDDENNELITADAYEGKTISVKGLAGSYDGEWQIVVFSANNIIISD